MPRSTVLVLAAAACLIGTDPDTPADPLEPFSLGVLRQDGMLLPFASFDGRKWRNSWPLPPRRADVPIGVEDVPEKWWPNRQPLLEWTLWTPDGDLHPVHVVQPAFTQVQCEGAIALRTSWTIDTPLPPLTEQPYPKVGLATTGSRPVEPVAMVDSQSVEWQQVAERLAGPLNEAERAAVSWEHGHGWNHPVKAGDREATPMTLEAVYRAPFVAPGSFVYYVEATRRYPPAASSLDPSCDLVTFAGGWLAIDRTGSSSNNITALVTDCGRVVVRAMLPLGVLRLEDRILWVAQWSGWLAEEYAVVELGPPLEDRTLIETRAGSCL